jgi:hypothetical protein
VAEPEAAWCVVANVVAEAFGNASSPGTKHFRAGALVWVTRGYWGEGARITVIGRHRGSLRFVAIVEDIARFTNWRAKAAYHPAVLALLRREGSDWTTQAACEEAARRFAERHPPIADLSDEIARRREALQRFDDDDEARALYGQAVSALARWTPQQRNADRRPPHEVSVLADWLEAEGLPIELSELVRTLDRRRKL